jgi:AraC-like DNA-binding protein
MDPVMQRAVGALRSGILLEDLARRSGMSMKTLQRRFHNEVGLSPKAYQRVVRFRRAFRLLQGNRNGAEVAAMAGYYDQAHLIREFTRLAGSSPRRFFRPEEPTLAQAFLSDLAVGPAHREINALDSV